MQQALYGILDTLKSLGSLFHGAKGSIGASAVQLSSTSRPLQKGVWLYGAAGNSTNIVYVGVSNAVTANSADATDGFPIATNATVFVPVDNLNKIWLIGSTTNLKVFYLAG